MHILPAYSRVLLIVHKLSHSPLLSGVLLTSSVVGLFLFPSCMEPLVNSDVLDGIVVFTTIAGLLFISFVWFGIIAKYVRRLHYIPYQQELEMCHLDVNCLVDTNDALIVCGLYKTLTLIDVSVYDVPQRITIIGQDGFFRDTRLDTTQVPGTPRTYAVDISNLELLRITVSPGRIGHECALRRMEGT